MKDSHSQTEYWFFSSFLFLVQENQFSENDAMALKILIQFAEHQQLFLHLLQQGYNISMKMKTWERNLVFLFYTWNSATLAMHLKRCKQSGKIMAGGVTQQNKEVHVYTHKETKKHTQG